MPSVRISERILPFIRLKYVSILIRQSVLETYERSVLIIFYPLFHPLVLFCAKKQA